MTHTLDDRPPPDPQLVPVDTAADYDWSTPPRYEDYEWATTRGETALTPVK